MIETIEISYFFTQYLGIFILMLSTFLIGYFSSLWLHKSKYKTIIKRLKNTQKILVVLKNRLQRCILINHNLKNIYKFQFVKILDYSKK